MTADTTARGPQPIDREDLLDDLRAGAAVLGRPPSMNEMREFGAYHPQTYLKRFGSWLDALEVAGLDVSDFRKRCAGNGGSDG